MNTNLTNVNCRYHLPNIFLNKLLLKIDPDFDINGLNSSFHFFLNFSRYLLGILI